MTAPTVDELVSKIRDLAPHLPYAGMRVRGDEWHQEWNRVCAAMDALGDVEHAISAYWKTDDVGYLHIYGLLQSLVVAQDAANLLREHLTDEGRISWQKSEEYVAVHRIRTIRNESIGHPTASDVFEQGRKAKRQAGVGIVRISMSKAGFTYYLHDQRQATPVVVDTAQLVHDQNRAMIRILGVVVTTMTDRVQEHRAAFKEVPLKPVWEEFDEERFKTFDDSTVHDFQVVLRRIDAGIEERCGDLETNSMHTGIAWYQRELKTELGRSEALHILSGAPRRAGDELRDLWRGLGQELAYLDEAFADASHMS